MLIKKRNHFQGKTCVWTGGENAVRNEIIFNTNYI